MSLKNSALLVIDMQYDFMQGGSLEVQGANELIPYINKLMTLNWGLIAASKDWHPSDHISFASNHSHANAFETITLDDQSEQVMWPDHCVQNTTGSEIHDQINSSLFDAIVLQGQNSKVDSYSAFFDNNHLEKTQLHAVLLCKKISSIYLVGLAADFCVKYTAIDGQSLGFDTHFIFDATRSVNPEDNSNLIQQLQLKKIEINSTQQLIELNQPKNKQS